MEQLQKIVLLLALTISCCDAAAQRLHATHTDAGLGLTNRELLHRMVARSKARATRLLSGSARVDPGAYAGAVPDTEYLAHFAVGTPPQPVQLTLDTGSDLVWTQCKPCQACFDQTLPFFDPANSTTVSGLLCRTPVCQSLNLYSCGRQGWGNDSCVYTYSYGDRSITNGVLATETFTFAGGSSAAGVAFGCGVLNQGVFKSNETGIAGFGRGPLSLPSQLKVGNFSYCFTPITGSEPSTVLLGAPANLYSDARGPVQSTRLIQNPSSPSFYYLPLKGVTVGSTRLNVSESTFALKRDGTGGAIIDSGTGMTTLPQAVYKLVADAFVAQAGLPVYNSTASSVTQLCFTAPPQRAKPRVPRLALHFEGATLDLPRENYMFEFQDAGSSVTCLALNPGGDLTIIGNYQQQNMHVLYDTANSLLSFVPAQCSKL